MLYTFSKAEYAPETLSSFLTHLTENDAVVLWQDGVLQAVKNREFFAHLPNCYLLEQDITARSLYQTTNTFKKISLSEFIMLTERYSPHIAI
ncbi:sulfurtransferase complex subunit TusB [Mannheimia sp. AT1]|uniref:Sulfurtransferase complex subunit TusB n=1 Tax=Mannheimia cairinae TaxID=3025936 RepID=A0ABT5MPS4_9PAST|nr:sulfurtransferase complex subunit TusB [Mannheimia cairinae]MDD0824176.1 sulfurtransferase complex subunit TusB [Mannheimia cairinae]MDD0826881.1 sulfurtransferase complex subunit TusB [Mannheimia cairinae]